MRHRARGLLTAPPCRSPEGRNPGCDGDPRSSEPIRLAADFTALLLAHPNVVAYVAGHHHTNRVTAYRRPDGPGGPIAAPPAGTPGARFARSQLAAIGRTSSFNDPQSETNGGPGTPTDRNVELLLADPRR